MLSLLSVAWAQLCDPAQAPIMPVVCGSIDMVLSTGVNTGEGEKVYTEQTSTGPNGKVEPSHVLLSITSIFSHLRGQKRDMCPACSSAPYHRSRTMRHVRGVIF